VENDQPRNQQTDREIQEPGSLTTMLQNFLRQAASVCKVIPDILRMTGPHRNFLLFATSINLIVAVFAALSTILAVDVIFLILKTDSVLPEIVKPLLEAFPVAKEYRLELIGIFFVVITTMVQLTLQGLANTLRVIAAARIATYVRLHILENSLTAKFSYLDDAKTGWIKQVLTSNVTGLVPIFQALVTIFGSVLSAVILAVVLVKIAPVLTLAFLFFCILLIPFKVSLTRIIHRLSSASALARNELMKHLSETMDGIRQIKLQNRTREFSNYIKKDSNQAERSDKNAAIIGSWEPLLIHLALLSSFVFIIFGHELLGVTKIATLISFLFVLQRTVAPVTTANTALTSMIRKLPHARYVSEFFWHQKAEQERGRGDREPIQFVNEIKVDSVTLSYSKGTPILSDVSLEARRGEFIAVVGKSGAGKSSLLHLLLNMYSPDSGVIRINDKPLDKLHPSVIRNCIGLVSQDVHIFDTTVAEYIRGGNDALTQSEIEAAAMAADAHNFIDALPKGYQSTVGATGNKLSGGQRQRLFIAQVFARNTPVLILDEGTSALDTISEGRILELIKQRQKDRIVIVITHRLPLIRDADRIYVLDNGQIVQSGKFDELKSEPGVFAKLWHRDTSTNTETFPNSTI
jgi:ABC-type multidrug transport system fused ATPase/permease subunit